ncbi:hypothetical protein PGT21_027029 [Puccinia graminis f. sp. tritici]|uniref:Uncharacterized protein n=1 Tax=Puccinia graminis f. sp. tritici TaxID=56615 RepID=A0A5B0QUM9_PUCGR|nr:hypothetical protein PGT21_027029 [Puccinia graminis f. sp. tritici]KAA1116998.1 hypothetical protein PGTUg99_033709 [Puccinia graminis f. sp. tritici]
MARSRRILFSASASPLPLSGTLPSQLPSCQSTRVVTPVKSHSNYIRPNDDARRSLQKRKQNVGRANVGQSSSQLQSQNTPKRKKHQQLSCSSTPTDGVPTTTTKSRKRTTTTKSRKRTYKNRHRSPTTDTEADEGIRFMDLAQDSDEENTKIKKTRGKKVCNFDRIEEFFNPPQYGKDQTTGVKLYYSCKWCTGLFKSGKQSKSNLTKHRDGNASRNPCSGRTDAIRNGAQLPVTVKEQNIKKRQGQTLDKYVASATFDNHVLNQILVMWLVLSALPWSRIEDKLLPISFNYARPGIKLYSRTYAALEACKLYVNLRDTVISHLKVFFTVNLTGLIHSIS